MIPQYREIKAGEDSRKNWPEINRANQNARHIEARVSKLEASQRQKFQWDVHGAVQRFVVFTEEDDHLVCRKLSFEDVWTSDDILVAKEIPLRLAGKPSADHEIRPAFVEQDPESETLDGTVIYAVKPTGGTGLIVDDEVVLWLMLDDTRDWAYPLLFRDAADSCILKQLWVKSSDAVTTV